jgi:hypothetical protein
MTSIRMDEVGYERFDDGDYDCTIGYYTFDLDNGNVVLFMQPDPEDEEFGSGMSLGAVTDCELNQVEQNGQVFNYCRVSDPFTIIMHEF